MFRYNLKGSNTVTLEQELEQSKYYIYIMQLRFDYLFQVEYRIDETLLQYKIIKFSLQPFIENAIIHGFTDFQQEGTLSISILRNNDSRIQIQISDDGHGMSFDTLDGLKEAFSSIQNSPSRRLKMTLSVLPILTSSFSSISAGTMRFGWNLPWKRVLWLRFFFQGF